MKRVCAFFLFLFFVATPLLARDEEKVIVMSVEQDADAANGGVIYALPQTVVRVKLTAKVVVCTTGPFYKYSTRYLNLSDVVTTNSVKWSLVSAEVSTYGVADPDRRFKITASPATALPGVRLAPDGTLIGFNMSENQDRKDLVLQSIVAAAPPYHSFEGVRLPQSALTRTSSASMAEETANNIYALRSIRQELLTGANEAQLPDAGAYQRVLEETFKQEDDLISLFAGWRDTVCVSRFVDIIPDSETPDNVVPIRFSESDGFVDAMDLSGSPIYVDLQFTAPRHVNAYPDGSKMRQKKPIEGFRYLLPGQVSVRVSDRNRLMRQATFECSQNAQEISISSDMLRTHTLVIDPSTGALLLLQPK